MQTGDFESTIGVVAEKKVHRRRRNGVGTDGSDVARSILTDKINEAVGLASVVVKANEVTSFTTIASWIAGVIVVGAVDDLRDGGSDVVDQVQVASTDVVELAVLVDVGVLVHQSNLQAVREGGDDRERDGLALAVGAHETGLALIAGDTSPVAIDGVVVARASTGDFVA